MKDKWSGTIIFVGQPAEEMVGGARALLKAGLYNRFGKPDFALGFHDKADLQTGHIGVTPGYTYANVDSVDVTVRGIGGPGRGGDEHRSERIADTRARSADADTGIRPPRPMKTRDSEVG